MRKPLQSKKISTDVPLEKQSAKSFRIWQSIARFMQKILKGNAIQPHFSYRHILFSFIGGFFGIAVLAYLTTSSGYPLIAAPFGATTVLIFGVPDSPLGQPRNVVGGNFISGLISVILVHFFGAEPWVMALAVATALMLMQLTKTTHPPGGAVALLGVISHASWSFALTPILLGSVLIVLCTVIFNNLVPGRSYPRHWI